MLKTRRIGTHMERCRAPGSARGGPGTSWGTPRAHRRSPAIYPQIVDIYQAGASFLFFTHYI